MKKNLVGSLIVLVVACFSFVSLNSRQKEAVAPSPSTPLRYIYLTFDDGPLNGSENIDSVILAERLKISVFLVGEHALQTKEMGTYYKMYEQNPFVETYNHSYTHANNKYASFYSNPAGVLADIQKNEALLNLRYKIVRLPGRNIWRIGDRK